MAKHLNKHYAVIDTSSLQVANNGWLEKDESRAIEDFILKEVIIFKALNGLLAPKVRS